MHLSLKMLSGMANSVDPYQTAPSGSGYALFAYGTFVGNFGVQNFRTFTLRTVVPKVDCTHRSICSTQSV